MRITQDHGTPADLAARTSPCAACGATVYRERVFANAIQTARPDGVRVALELLLARVRRWRQEPICCETCPERVAVNGS